MAFSASNMASETRVAARSTSGVRGAGLGCMGLDRRLANSHHSHTVSAAAGCAKTRATAAATFRTARRMVSLFPGCWTLKGSVLRVCGRYGPERALVRSAGAATSALVIYYTITPYHRASVSSQRSAFGEVTS